MRKPLLILCMNFIVGHIYAQEIDNRTKVYLVKEQIDSFFIYSEFCNGNILAFDSCSNETPQYAFIHKRGETSIVKIDACTIYMPIKLSVNNPFEYYINNRDSIHKEVIKPPRYFYKRKKLFKTVLMEVSSSVSHSCFHTFKSTTFKTDIAVDTYDLTFKTFDDGRENIYYDANQKTKTNSLIKLTTALIKQLEEEKRFTKN